MHYLFDMKKWTLYFILLFLTGCFSHSKDNQEKIIIQLIQKNQILDIFSLISTNKLSFDTFFKDGKTLMTLAIDANNKELIERLIEAGISLDLQDQQGNSALIYALLKKKTDIALNLLNLQPNVDLQNKEGNSALIIAVKNQEWNLVQKLLKAEVNPLLKDKMGKTALDYLDKNQSFYSTLNQYVNSYLIETQD